MSASSRFASPTSGFDVDELLGQLRKIFWLSLGLAVVLHLLLVAIDPFKEQAAKAPKPLTTKFIKREPRLTKPLELRKIPQPKRKMVKREVKLAAARMDQVQATASFNTGAVVGRVSSPGVNFSRAAAVSTLDLEPRGLTAASLAGTRAPENKVDMALEMLDIRSMDTGRYRAMVVQDPNNRQNLTGFVRLAYVTSARAVSAGVTGMGQLKMSETDLIRDMLNNYTGIQADFLGSITFDDERLLEVPIILPEGRGLMGELPGAPNESELEALSRYLMSGGFIIGSCIADAGGRGSQSQGVKENGAIGLMAIWDEAVEKYGGLSEGTDYWVERIPEDHPIYTSYFDLGGGVPSGYDPNLGSGKQGIKSWNVLFGYYIKDRLIGVTPSQDWGWRNHEKSGDATRQLQMAVNIIVYALTQEGSMTQRLMQMVN